MADKIPPAATMHPTSLPDDTAKEIQLSVTKAPSSYRMVELSALEREKAAKLAQVADEHNKTIQDEEDRVFEKARQLNLKLGQGEAAKREVEARKLADEEALREQRLFQQQTIMSAFERQMRAEAQMRVEANRLLEDQSHKRREIEAFANIEAVITKLELEQERRRRHEAKRLAAEVQAREEKLRKQKAALEEFDEQRRIKQMSPSEKEVYLAAKAKQYDFAERAARDAAEAEERARVGEQEAVQSFESGHVDTAGGVPKTNTIPTVIQQTSFLPSVTSDESAGIVTSAVSRTAINDTNAAASSTRDWEEPKNKGLEADECFLISASPSLQTRQIMSSVSRGTMEVAAQVAPGFYTPASSSSSMMSETRSGSTTGPSTLENSSSSSTQTNRKENSGIRKTAATPPAVNTSGSRSSNSALEVCEKHLPRLLSVDIPSGAGDDEFDMESMIKEVVKRVNSLDTSPAHSPVGTPMNKDASTRPLTALLRRRSQRRQSSPLGRDSWPPNEVRLRDISTSADDAFVYLPTLGTTEAGDYTQPHGSSVSKKGATHGINRHQQPSKSSARRLSEEYCCIIS
ncbi:hypothetical protein SeMB42_g04293 [Synchytrium endobioticum]|uniref:Uncharacterized protein n=1 Tax=Synchytrium endobioticum TaxID=286115 RepID=A0A507CZQ8_9FUNG|nr:hypothetical protein SeMB42_g04293 [Synchytrium endobioticum]TPX47321.1 hypothetical protein SeLEV6574_g02729 [Synchytrium endobioticum]